MKENKEKKEFIFSALQKSKGLLTTYFSWTAVVAFATLSGTTFSVVGKMYYDRHQTAPKISSLDEDPDFKNQRLSNSANSSKMSASSSSSSPTRSPASALSSTAAISKPSVTSSNSVPFDRSSNRNFNDGNSETRAPEEQRPALDNNSYSQAVSSPASSQSGPSGFVSAPFSGSQSSTASQNGTSASNSGSNGGSSSGSGSGGGSFESSPGAIGAGVGQSSTATTTASTITSTSSSNNYIASAPISSVTAPSVLVYSTNPATYTEGSAITSNTPTNSGGAITSYSVSPALPTGLNFNTTTGLISGTPTAIASTASYVVTGTNSGGNTTVTVSITVNDAAPTALTYSTNPATYTKGTAITNNTPSNSGGAITSYSVSPSLPAGLSLNSSSGAITGTPTAITSTTSYTVTGTNTGGSTTVSVSIAVNAASFNGVWNFISSNSSQFTYGNTIDFSGPGSVCELEPTPQTDDAATSLNASTGFTGGTYLGAAQWDSTYVRLGSATPIIELDPSWTPAWPSLIAYWKFNDSIGSTNLVDSSGSGNTGITQGGMTLGEAGVLNTAASFDGSSGAMTSTTSFNNPGSYTISAWFKTTTTSGGKIVGFGSAQYGQSSNYDRHLYMSNSGAINYGVYNGNTVVLTTTQSYNDGNWHYVAATLDPVAGMAFYVDGQLAGTNGNTFGQNYIGYWHVGFDNMNLWGNEPSSYYFNGSIDDVAIWSTALSASAVMNIYQHESSKYAGTLTSRVMDSGLNAGNWTSLSWTSTFPFGKALPDNGTSESSTNYSLTTASLMSGITGLWHLDDAVGASSVVDSSGNNNNGTATNITFGAAGKFGNSAQFSSSVISYITLPSVLSQSAYTKSVWVFDSSSVGENIFSSASGSGHALYIHGGYLASAHNGSFSSPQTIDSSLFPLNTWTLATVTYDSTVAGGTMLLYKNGLLVSTATGVSTPSDQTLQVGAFDNNFPMVGSEDEAAVWSRALTAGEVMELYRRGANRVKYQVRSCTSSTCADDVTGNNWKGSDGTNQSYYSELDNTASYNTTMNTPTGAVSASAPTMTFAHFSSPVPPANRYFQYRAILESDDTSLACNYGSGQTWCSPEIQSVVIGPNHYDTTSPTVMTKTGISFVSLSSAIETLGSGSCSSGVVYNLGDGTNWYYWNGSAWATAGGTTSTANSVAALTNAVLSNYSTSFGAGTVYLKAFLQSNGTSACQLSSFELDGLD